MNEKGVSVIGAIIAVLLLFATGSALLYFTASNQQVKIQQVTSDQSFYSVQAGMEFALGEIIKNSSPEVSWSPKFAGETISIVRSSGVLTSSAQKRSAYSTHSISDPEPSSGENCLVVDVTGAYVASNRLEGIVVKKDPSCNAILTVTGMTGTSWQPNNGELLERIRLDVGGDEFGGPPTASGGNFDFGANDFLMNDFSDHNLQLWFDSMDQNHDFELIIQFTYASANYVKTVSVDFLADNQADCFVWDTSNGRLTYGLGNLWDQLTGTTVLNNCSSPIRLDKMTVSWLPATPTRNLNIVGVNSNDIYNSSVGNSVEIDVDHTLPASMSHSLNYFDFDNEMLEGARNYAVSWKFSDGSVASTTFDIFNSNQNNCLVIDTTNVSASCNQLVGLILVNNCSSDIGIVSLSVSWVGDSGRRLTSALIDDTDGSNTYSGSYSSGATMSFGNNDLYYIDGSGTKLLQYLQFNNNITVGSNYTLTFTMADQTLKSVVVTPIVPTQASCLNVNTSGAYLASSNRRLQGITISNSCCFAIVWAQTNVSWTPLTPARNMQTIRVDNSNRWSGSVVSGTTVNNSDITISPSPAVPPTINYFNFSSGMAGRTFMINFIMGDGTTKSVGPFTP